MKASELKNYKTLDITKISGTPWNTAEKVLGLDENDKVVMAETDESVSPEYVENAISEAMEAETSRTESTYAKKSEVTGYTTTEEVNQAIETAMEAETARTENTYAKPADIPSLDGYATEQYVDDAIADIPQVDLSGYAKTTAVTQDIQTAIAAETARTEDVYAKKSEIPSLDGYATEAWVEGKGYITGVTVDAELTSGSTNAVQSKAIYEALNGETASTQMEISSVDSTIELRYQFYGSTDSSQMSANFKETNIDGYYVIDLGDLPVGEAQNISSVLIDSIIINSTNYRFENYNPDTSNIGQKVLVDPNGLFLFMSLGSLGGTYDYYFVLNTNENYVFLSTTLPILTEVTDHKANISDLPTAQDGSDFKQFAYNGEGNKQIASRVSVSPAVDWGHSVLKKKGEINYEIRNTIYPWNSGVGSGTRTAFTIGSEYLPGIKSIRDSVIIDKADQALYGFTEQITLTPTSASTDYISDYGTKYYFSKTNDTRYLVYSLASGTLNITNVYLSGVKYAIKNAPNQTVGNYPINGIYQLVEVGNQYNSTSLYLSTPCYAIIDKELLTIEIADSLTITRAKSIQDALDNIPAPDMSNYYTKAETDAEITGATQDMATKTWVGEQGYLTQQDISGKLDASTFNTYTGATETAIAAKQDALVSGTNIKTINNQSILGSGNIDIQGGSGPIIPAITSQTDYEAISGDVKTGDLIQVYGVDINDDGGEAYGLFQAEVQEFEDQGVIAKQIVWYRKDNADSIMRADAFYPWMTDNDVWPVDFGEGSFLISTDDNSEDEAYNGIGFDDNGKPVTTHIVPEYDEQTGEITGVTRTDTPIGADDGSIVRYDIDREAELANAGYNTKLVTQEYDENEGATLPTIVGHMEEGILNGVKIDGHSIAKVSGYIHQQSEPTPGPVFDFTQNDELATQAYVTAATENLASQGYVDAAITAATNDLATEAYVTAATATKQDTLVSGTNIKTINNQSLLGSGNIDIQGGGGGGSVVELTKAQYDALDPPAQDTTYIITDAETVDLNDYAMASGLTELSAATDTALATKADKANTTARSAPYLPSWNAQGIITGSSKYHQGAFEMNGTALGNVIKSGNSLGATWYAPTSAGTAGQPLLSNGSGAPVWGQFSFQFISQSAYDALTTKSSTTIYFIVDPS